MYNKEYIPLPINCYYSHAMAEIPRKVKNNQSG